MMMIKFRGIEHTNGMVRLTVFVGPEEGRLQNAGAVMLYPEEAKTFVDLMHAGAWARRRDAAEDGPDAVPVDVDVAVEGWFG